MSERMTFKCRCGAELLRAEGSDDWKCPKCSAMFAPMQLQPQLQRLICVEDGHGDRDAWPHAAAVMGYEAEGFGK